MTGAEPSRPRYAIEAFDPARHDRAGFSSGVAPVDNFLKLTAKKQQAGDFSRVWVAVPVGGDQIAGYYAINSHAIEGADLPPGLVRGAPGHGMVPAVYLSMFGVVSVDQGKGLGRLLLADALKRIVRIADQMGIAAVVLDILDDGVAENVARRRTLYAGFGFMPFPSRPLRLYMTLRDIRASLPKR